MSNPLDTLTPGGRAAVLPLELLQPLDSNNPASTPVRLSGPEQRLVVTPDPGVDGRDGSWLPPSQLLISKDGVTRSIWPVHLAGWQALGWQLQPDAAHQSRSPNNQSRSRSQSRSQSNQSPIWSRPGWRTRGRACPRASPGAGVGLPLNRSPPRKPPLAAPLVATLAVVRPCWLLSRLTSRR
jgi:hypothetical protein